MVEVKLDNAYKKRYKMRALGEDGHNTVVSLPRAFLEREADKRGLTVRKFLEDFRAVAHFNGFEGIYYSFEEETNAAASR